MKIVEVGACKGSEAFLLITETHAALIDSGFSFCAEQMVRNIKQELGDRTLDYVLLTHSHYDHASGSPYCKAYWPSAQVVAGEYAAKIVAKPSAIQLMKEMNQSAALQHGITAYEDKLDALHVDKLVKDGDNIDLGEVSLQVIEAPGHTKCSIAFYIPQNQMLISSETLGVHAGGNQVSPCYLVGYQMSVNFIKKVMQINPHSILIPHYGVLEGDACRTFIQDALRCNKELKDLIVGLHKEGKTYEEMLESYKERFFTPEHRKTQPVKAFELNAKYMIPMIIAECGNPS